MADFLTQAWPYAAAVLVVLGVIALVFLVIILFRLSKTLKSVQSMAEEAQKEVTPALAKVNPMVDKAELLVDTVNLEMLRVDSILEDVEQISSVAGKTANTVDTVASAPAEAVTSLVDRIRGSISTKRADKLKQSRVVYPIGSGKESEESAAQVAATVESNEEAIRQAAQTVVEPGSEAIDIDGSPKPAPTASIEIPDVVSTDGKQGAAEDAQPVGRHSIKPAAAEEPADQEAAE